MATVAGTVEIADVYAALETVNDPELPMSVVDLGMVYDVRVADGAVEVDVSLTSTGCPMRDPILDDVRETVGAIPGVRQVKVNLVWDPPWTHERITPKGREALGNWGIGA